MGYNPRQYRADGPGAVPGSGVGSVAGVDLPPGRPIQLLGAEAAVCWVTDSLIGEPADLFSELRRVFYRSGLWPLLVYNDNGWMTSRLTPGFATSDPDAVDLLAAIAPNYAAKIANYFERYPIVRRSFGPSLTALAPPSTAMSDPAAADNVADNRGGYQLALVPTTRPADIVLQLGWNGAMTGWGQWIGYDTGTVTAILRSLEDRFEAVPTVLYPDTIELGVQRPPAPGDEALALATELIGMYSHDMGNLDDLDRDYIRGIARSQFMQLF